VPDDFRRMANVNPVLAFVQLKTREGATSDELREHCARALAKFKVPVAVEIRETLAVSNLGKVLRKGSRRRGGRPRLRRPSSAADGLSVRERDVLDVLGLETEAPHGGRPVQERREARASQRPSEDRDLRMIDLEGDDS